MHWLIFTLHSMPPLVAPTEQSSTGLTLPIHGYLDVYFGGAQVARKERAASSRKGRWWNEYLVKGGICDGVHILPYLAYPLSVVTFSPSGPRPQHPHTHAPARTYTLAQTRIHPEWRRIYKPGRRKSLASNAGEGTEGAEGGGGVGGGVAAPVGSDGDGA